MESLEYIDDFFNGSLSLAEKEQFQHRIENDPGFASELAFYLDAHQAVNERLALEKKQHFREVLAANPVFATKYIPLYRKWWVYASAAAVIILVITGWFLFAKPSNIQNLTDQYIVANFSNLGVNMGAADSLQNGLALFNDKKYTDALALFENIIRYDTHSSRARKYAGITALKMGEYDKAITYFEQLTEMNIVANPGKLYTALAMLKRNAAGDQEKAKQLLQEVVRDDLEGRETAETLLKDF